MGTLAFTGVHVLSLLILGAGLVFLGAGLVRTSVRRRVHRP